MNTQFQKKLINLEEKMIKYIREVSKDKCLPTDLTEFYVKELIKNEFDLRTIAKIEAYLEKEILIIPSKNEWRKLKLQNINEKL